MTFRDYHGAVHVHTIYSDGSGTIPEIIHLGQQARLDFLILTEHANTRIDQAGWEGWHDDLLVMVGAEVGSPRLRHYLVLGIQDPSDLKEKPLAEGLAEVRARGGYSFVAHPRGIDVIGLRMPPWRAWDNPDFSGIEVWSWMHDWIEGFRWRRLPGFYRNPERRITGPHPEALAAWDRVAMRRRVSGFAGLDAHAKPLFWRWLKVFPYEMLFGTTLTHVLTEPFSGESQADINRVVEAMVAGRCYMAYHVAGDPTGFRFCGRTQRGEVEMGGEVGLDVAPVLCVRLPAAGEVRLVACGQEAGRAGGKRAEFRPEMRGPHRIEVRRDSRPWIFSNHIYVT